MFRRVGFVRAALVAAGTLLTTAWVLEPQGAPAEATDSRCYGRKVTVLGTAGDDVVRGTRRRDVIATLDGNDRVTGLRGEDTVCTAAGNDTVTDVSSCCVAIKLGGGDDRLEAREFAWFFAGRGNDVVIIDSPDNVELIVNLGPGDDRVVASEPQGRRARFMEFGSVCVSFAFARHPTRVDLDRGVAQGQGRDRFRRVRCVYGSPHRDHVLGSARSDYIQDGGGPLQVEARGGSDFVNGSRDDDLVALGRGDDSYNGGAGADQAYGGPGNDELSGDEGVDSLYGGRGDDEVRGAYHCYSNSERFPVSDGSPNELFGGPGDDYLIGDAGTDLLDGGPGHDRGFGQDDGLLDTLVSIEEPTYC